MSRSCCSVWFLCGGYRWRPWQRWQLAVQQLHEYSYERKYEYSTTTSTSSAIPCPGATATILVANNRTKATIWRRRLKTSKIKLFIFSLVRPPQFSVFSAVHNGREHPELAMIIIRMAWCWWQPNQKPLNVLVRRQHISSFPYSIPPAISRTPRIQTKNSNLSLVHQIAFVWPNTANSFEMGMEEKKKWIESFAASRSQPPELIINNNKKK